MKKQIAILPGDGIGPEIMAEAVKVLRRIESKFGHSFELIDGLIGGSAWDAHGSHFPKETLELCDEADAILFGAAGGPVNAQDEEKWRDCERNAVLGLRKALNFNINLRPIIVYPALREHCPLRSEIIGDGVDILCVRELSGGIYFGEHRTAGGPGQRVATDVMVYEEETICLAAHAAFQAAESRRKFVTSVDKANVLDCSRLWRSVVDEVAREYLQCTHEHMLVDNCAMQVITRPRHFDVLLMPNMFGDILSDELSVLSGSLGMLPSASLNPEGKGMYEPAGGSAHDIANRGLANPIGQILSAAMMLKYSFGLNEEYDAVESAISAALDADIKTKDIGDEQYVSTAAFGDAVADIL